jgi:hypothetical protein
MEYSPQSRRLRALLRLIREEAGLSQPDFRYSIDVWIFYGSGTVDLLGIFGVWWVKVRVVATKALLPVDFPVRMGACF